MWWTRSVFCQEGDNDEDLDRAVCKISGDLVIQEALKQHDTLSKLNPSSVNTCRVLSMLNNEEVKIYSTIIRMGIGESKVDNASSGGITCGINSYDRLKDRAYAQNGKMYTSHPTTGLGFDEIVVPSYRQIIEQTKKTTP